MTIIAKDEAGESFPSLLRLSAIAVSNALNRRDLREKWDLSILPIHAANQIIEKAYDGGYISLGFLLRFAQVPLSSLNLSGCGVSDNWIPLLASLPLSSLDLSRNPGVTDEGLFALAGISSPSSPNDAHGGGFPRKPRRSSNATKADNGGRRRRSSNTNRF
jgi:hypothetical protein